MFGYVVANQEQLTAEQEALYRSYYCGLCRSLKRQFGNFGRLTLNYDMTFLALLLADLFEPECRTVTERCIVHPAKQKTMAENALIDYGAAMNILLAYHNLMDDWADEHKHSARTAAGRLARFIPSIEAQYPRQARAVQEGMQALHAEEQKRPQDLDTAANLFGRLLGQLFIYQKEHFWAKDCYTLGAALGRFIYWMDAYEDLPHDRKKGSYNPMILIADQPDYEGRVMEMLKNTLGECALILERLPLVEHLELLRNILYSGIWSRYERLKKGEQKA